MCVKFEVLTEIFNIYGHKYERTNEKGNVSHSTMKGDQNIHYDIDLKLRASFTNVAATIDKYRKNKQIWLQKENYRLEHLLFQS